MPLSEEHLFVIYLSAESWIFFFLFYYIIILFELSEKFLILYFITYFVTFNTYSTDTSKIQNNRIQLNENFSTIYLNDIYRLICILIIFIFIIAIKLKFRLNEAGVSIYACCLCLVYRVNFVYV